jgi:myosin XVIII
MNSFFFKYSIAEDDDGLNEDYNVYKLKYESAAKELEFTKKRLHSQHEHDLEQLVGLKKQLEKKVSTAYIFKFLFFIS